jgi:hypothetical protein
MPEIVDYSNNIVMLVGVVALWLMLTTAGMR